MTQTAPDTESFSEDDLFFTCPHCGKSMAIEKRGMGLTVQCPDCQGLVKVPKLTDAELKEKIQEHIDGENAQPDSFSHLAYLDEVRDRLQGVLEKYRELETRLNRQQETVLSMRAEVKTLQEAMEELTRHVENSPVPSP